MMTYEFIKTEVRDQIGWLEYYRPPVNAVNWEMLRELPAAFRELLSDEGGAGRRSR